MAPGNSGDLGLVVLLALLSVVLVVLLALSWGRVCGTLILLAFSGGWRPAVLYLA